MQPDPGGSLPERRRASEGAGRARAGACAGVGAARRADPRGGPARRRADRDRARRRRGGRGEHRGRRHGGAHRLGRLPLRGATPSPAARPPDPRRAPPCPWRSCRRGHPPAGGGWPSQAPSWRAPSWCSRRSARAAPRSSAGERRCPRDGAPAPSSAGPPPSRRRRPRRARPSGAGDAGPPGQGVCEHEVAASLSCRRHAGPRYGSSRREAAPSRTRAAPSWRRSCTSPGSPRRSRLTPGDCDAERSRCGTHHEGMASARAHPSGLDLSTLPPSTGVDTARTRPPGSRPRGSPCSGRATRRAGSARSSSCPPAIRAHGRSGAAPRGGDDRRLSLARQVPGALVPGAPLACPRISREQLRLSPSPGGGILVENIGACPLLHRGGEVRHADVTPGDTLSLRNELLFLCVRRAPIAPASSSDLAVPIHPFGEPDAFGIVGESAPVWELRHRIVAVARLPFHVLIEGESGSGKELVAQAIHVRSARGHRPWCRATPPPSPKGSPTPSSSATSGATRTPACPSGPGSSARRTSRRSSSTSSPSCRPASRPTCSGSWTTASTSASARRRRAGPTCASSRPPTAP